MASAPGLRRVVLGESLPKGGNGWVVGSPESNGRKPRPVFNRRSVIGLAILAIIAVVVIRIGISSVIVSPPLFHEEQNSQLRAIARDSVQPTTIQELSSSSHAKLEKKDATYDEDSFISNKPTRPLEASILARKPRRNQYSTRNCVADEGMDSALEIVSQAYHSPKAFYADFQEMACQFKIFVYPHSDEDAFAHIFRTSEKSLPTGNYASEHYFKLALMNSNLLTEDPSEADLFYMPFSIAMMRSDPNIGVPGIKYFVRDYVSNISAKYPYWNRTSGADHFYVNCHSIGKTATDAAYHIRSNAIQVVCSSSYHLQVYFPHKDAAIPQVWPRTDFPEKAALIEQRTTLAFFAGAGNSPVRAEVAKYWSNDSEIKVHTQRIKTPYDEALLSSRYCLHVKGYEVNTARLADAMHYGCVPIIIANYHDLPFNDVLDWTRISLVVTMEDIPKLKSIIKAVSEEEYVQMQKNVVQVRQHFEWHKKPQHFDAFYMVLYELWLRRNVVTFPVDD